MIFSKFMQLYKHHHNRIVGHFCHPKKIPPAYSLLLPLPIPSLRATNLPSVSIEIFPFWMFI